MCSSEYARTNLDSDEENANFKENCPLLEDSEDVLYERNGNLERKNSPLFDSRIESFIYATSNENDRNLTAVGFKLISANRPNFKSYLVKNGGFTIFSKFY